MTNFFKTVSVFFRNRYINPYGATLRHVGWEWRKVLNAFPCDVKLGTQVIRVADQSIANGVGAMVNAMGFYDPNNMYLLQELFQREIVSTFFDIGANIGVYSIICASIGRPVRVVAFEPHPYTFSLLEQNIKLNKMEKLISPLRLALGDHKGIVQFTDNPGNAENHVVEKTDGNLPLLDVELKTGEVICDELGYVPQVLKVDVEGYENQVLDGFGLKLSDVKLIFVECWNLQKTMDILSGHFGFRGPFKVDFRNRRFERGNIHYEDWVYVNPQFLEIFEDFILVKD